MLSNSAAPVSRLDRLALAYWERCIVADRCLCKLGLGWLCDRIETRVTRRFG